MILNLQEVNNGATYEGKVYDYFIVAETITGKKIKVFDPHGWSKRFRISDRIYADVGVTGVEFCDEQNAQFTGVIEKDKRFEISHLLVTQDGAFSVEFNDKKVLPPIGSTVYFNLIGNCSISRAVKIE